MQHRGGYQGQSEMEFGVSPELFQSEDSKTGPIRGLKNIMQHQGGDQGKSEMEFGDISGLAQSKASKTLCNIKAEIRTNQRWSLGTLRGWSDQRPQKHYAT